MGSRLVREGESELLKGDSEKEKGKRLSGRRWGSFEWGEGAPRDEGESQQHRGGVCSGKRESEDGACV